MSALVTPPHTLREVGLKLIDNGYNPIPIPRGRKGPLLKGWPEVRADRKQWESWLDNGMGDCGVGILCTDIAAIDLDIRRPEILEKVSDFCRRELGIVGHRIGMAPKILIPYRRAEPFTSSHTAEVYSPDDLKNQVEVLAGRAQFVAYAVHPETKQPYEWFGAQPLDTPVDLWPALTAKEAEAVKDYFLSIAPEQWPRKGKGTRAKVASSVPKALQTAPIPVLASMLNAIPNDVEYDSWIEVGKALYVGSGSENSEGCNLWHEWSAKNDSKNLPDVTDEKWPTFRDTHSLDANYLRRRARLHGWPRAADEFDVVEPLPVGSGYFLTYDQMIAMPEPEWMVEGILQKRSAALMFGKSNTFKSFLAIDLALSVATGRHWHGQAVKQGRVAYIATEGAIGVGTQRVPGWYDHHDMPAWRRRNLFLKTDAIAIDDTGAVNKLIDAISEAGGFDLIVLDIFGGTMSGSEVEDTTARAWVHGVQRLIANGSAVLTVAHTGWQDQTRARMHTHFWGSFDTRLKVEGDKDARTSVLSIERHKDADSLGVFPFRLDVDCGTLVPVLDRSALPSKTVKLNPAQKTALAVLEDVLEERGRVRDGQGWPECRVVEVDAWREGCRGRLTKTGQSNAERMAFKRALETLTAAGLIQLRDDLVWPAADE